MKKEKVRHAWIYGGVCEIRPPVYIRRPRALRRSLPGRRGDVEILIGMDNQGWMPKHVESSQVEGDNLRLMQSMLSPRCILMGSARMAGPDDGTQGSVGDQPRGWGRGRDPQTACRSG